MTLHGALRLPDGTPVRGRGLRRPPPPGPLPDFGLYVVGRPPQVPWPSEWVRWPDFWLPSDPAQAATAIRGLYDRAVGGADVEVACGGGVGRTGTVLACLATLTGLGPDEAVAWVRANHHRKAVETPWQRRWIRRFATSL
ncbi:protein tyrosine phosphatase [Herbidospora galbida]|uniref:Protein tyrosine phosphatase n=1 Tax=Herbidospora galbida TaxID=2575442 RepID=A0A4U3M8R6_9ACTN|nr:protein-tyrosine phosphatase family protein [Herbidospora galbida]TKK85271.1 protein tyrosine phosphatase [Herbidospora galbida]